MDSLDDLMTAQKKGRNVKELDPDLLTYLEMRRDALIMELHSLDRLLMAAGRLKRETIIRRIR